MELSYKNDESLKQLCIERSEAHRAADRYLAGTCRQDNESQFRGCDIGCHVYDIDPNFDSDDIDLHQVVSDMYGWPLWLCHLRDSLFEGVTDKFRKDLPVLISQSIPVGKNLDNVYYNLNIFIQQRNIERVNGLDIETALKSKVIASIEQVVEAHKLSIKGGDVDWSAAWSAGRLAARLAARSARSAEESAEESAAESAARSAEYDAIAHELLRLLKATN